MSASAQSWLRALLGLLPLALGCGPTPASVGAQRAAIVGGADDPGDPAVVSFQVAGLPYCSGALVGPTTVLTAGHCANLIGDSDQYFVAFGPDAHHPEHKVQVVTQLLHPQFTAEGAPYDFALLRLATPVTDVAPLPLGTAPLTEADVGQPIRHVGYGTSDEVDGTGGGTKRTATYPITEVDPLIVWSVGPGMQTCTGDSGGPGFVTRGGVEQVAAVVSDGPNCHDAGWDGRVDVVADWIATTRDAWTPDAGPPDAGPTSTDGGASDDPDGGCGCQGSGGAPAGPALALLAVARWLTMRPARPRAHPRWGRP